MAINEQIITGRKWRRLIDKVTDLWQRISYWTHSTDVEFNDNKTAETKVGAIDGITDSLASTSSRIAASAKSVKQLNDNLQFPDGVGFYPDVKNGKRGYNTDPARGAGTFSPFKRAGEPQTESLLPANWNQSGSPTGSRTLGPGHYIAVCFGMWGYANLSVTSGAIVTKNNIYNETGYYNGNQYAGVYVSVIEFIVQSGSTVTCSYSSSNAVVFGVIKLKDD